MLRHDTSTKVAAAVRALAVLCELVPDRQFRVIDCERGDDCSCMPILQAIQPCVLAKMTVVLCTTESGKYFVRTSEVMVPLRLSSCKPGILNYVLVQNPECFNEGRQTDLRIVLSAVTEWHDAAGIFHDARHYKAVENKWMEV